MQDDPLQAIKAAVLRCNKIEAIRLYREVFGVGLAEAKSAVEHLDVALRHPVGQLGSPSPCLLPSPGPALPGDVLAQIQAHLFQGQKIAAIRLYRDHHPAGLAEAKAVIDQMENNLRLQSPGAFTVRPNSGAAGCLILLLIVAGIAFGVWELRH